MRNIFEGLAAGAGVGGTIGCALGTLLAGSTILIPGIGPIIAAPLMLTTVATTTAVTTVSLGAVGTLAGAGIGGTAGAIEDIKEHFS